MKKFLAIFAAAVMLSGCGSKKEDKNSGQENSPSESSTVSSENVPENSKNSAAADSSEVPEKTESKPSAVSGESSGSSQFGTPEENVTDIAPVNYTAEDFTDISVSLIKQTGEPPLSLTKYDLTPLADKTAVLGENNYPGTYMFSQIYHGFFYVMVNYEDFRSLDTSWIVWEYDPESGECREFFRYDDPERDEYFMDMRFYAGELWLSGMTYRNEAGSDTFICRAAENGTIERSLSFHAEPEDYHSLYFHRQAPNPYQSSEPRLTVCFLNISTFSNGYGYDSKNTGEMYTYNGDSWDKLWSEEEPDLLPGGSICALAFRGRMLHTVTENRKTVCIGDDFRLETGLKGAKLCSASGNKLTFLVQDRFNSYIYTFDFDRMERCCLDLSEEGSCTKVMDLRDKLIIDNNNGSNRQLIIPHLGAVYELDIPDSLVVGRNFNMYGMQTGITRDYNGYQLWCLTHNGILDNMYDMSKLNELYVYNNKL